MEMSLHFRKSQCHYFNALVPGQLGTGSSRNEKSQKRSAQILGVERPLNNDCCPKAGSRVFNVSFGELKRQKMVISKVVVKLKQTCVR